MPTARITADQLNHPQFQGQSVRAVGRLTSINNGMVQLELQGRDGSSSPATVMCPNGIERYQLEHVGKGCYEVIGTLQPNSTITEMTTVFMGEDFGARATLLSRGTAPSARPRAPPRSRVRRPRPVRRDGHAHAPVPRPLLSRQARARGVSEEAAPPRGLVSRVDRRRRRWPASCERGSSDSELPRPTVVRSVGCSELAGSERARAHRT